MKKINIILTLFSLIALASCSGSENSSSSMEDRTNWSSEDLAVIESVIGEGNTLPFFPAFNELEYEKAYVDYSCNYAIITSVNACEDEEQFNTYLSYVTSLISIAGIVVQLILIKDSIDGSVGNESQL